LSQRVGKGLGVGRGQVTNAFRREAGLSPDLVEEHLNDIAESPMPFGVRLVCHLADVVGMARIFNESPMPFGVRLVCHG